MNRRGLFGLAAGAAAIAVAPKLPEPRLVAAVAEGPLGLPPWTTYVGPEQWNAWPDAATREWLLGRDLRQLNAIASAWNGEVLAEVAHDLRDDLSPRAVRLLRLAYEAGGRALALEPDAQLMESS